MAVHGGKRSYYQLTLASLALSESDKATASPAHSFAALMISALTIHRRLARGDDSEESARPITNFLDEREDIKFLPVC